MTEGNPVDEMIMTMYKIQDMIREMNNLHDTNIKDLTKVMLTHNKQIELIMKLCIHLDKRIRKLEGKT
jgi:hypothetical protein